MRDRAQTSVVHFAAVGPDDEPRSITAKVAALISKSRVLDPVLKNGFTGIKLHFGEAGATGHVRPEWIAEIVRAVTAISPHTFLTDTNVLYKNSSRTNAVDHLRLASAHGFTIERTGAPTIIADGLFGTDYTEIPVRGTHIKNAKIAGLIARCDSLIVASHVTGHMMTGMGAALKNLGMGCASRRGKYEQHCGVVPEISPKDCVGCDMCVGACPERAITVRDRVPHIDRAACAGCGECAVVCRTEAINIPWSETLDNLQAKMVEYACGAVEAVKHRVSFINFIIRVTKECDCMAKDDPSIVHDVGILASTDPVAIDTASIDLTLEAAGIDIFKKHHPRTDWSAQLRYAEELGLGKRSYRLERVDDGR